MKLIAIALVALALPHAAWGQLILFSTTLSGANEVPPRDTPAFGSGTATLDQTSMLFTFNYSFSGLLAPQTAAHIHLGPVGVNGPVLIGLGLGSPNSLSIILNDLQASQLLDSQWYVNVHSTLYPGGEIRGQILPVPVPEPSTYALGGVALLGLAILGRRGVARRRQAT